VSEAAAPMRLLLSGASGAGKTGAAQAAAAALHARGWRVAGVLSPGVWAEGRQVAINIVDLAGGQARRLAERADLAPALPGPATRRWQFDSQALDWANEVLARAAPCDLLVVDELGPLGFERGEGLTAGLAAADADGFRLGLFVVRPALLHLAYARWPGAEEIIVESPAGIACAIAHVLDHAQRAG
jgi:hypothetical protein